MRGKYLLLLFFILVPYVVRGACPEYNDDQDGCRRQEGCQYQLGTDFTDNICKSCEERRYCPQDAICSNGTLSPDGSCPCPEQFPSSMEGTTSIHDCYAPCANGDIDTTSDCGLRYIDDGQVLAELYCNTNNTLVLTGGYHFEWDVQNVTLGCYQNNRACNKFSAIDHDGDPLPDSNTMEGYAEWKPHYNNDNGGYNVSNCRYKSTNEPSASKHCTRTVFYSPRNDDQHVSNAQEAIEFYTGDNYVTNADYYYCTSCEDGPYYPTNTNATNCANPTDQENSGTIYYMACSCEQIPQGYYRRTQWNYEQPVNSTPLDTYYTACPAGKTTQNNIGGTSSGDCTYTRDTKFCDANGCFKITDTDSWNWSD